LREGGYVREGLSNGRGARRENRQGWRRKRKAYIRNGKEDTDNNSKKEPKRDQEEKEESKCGLSQRSKQNHRHAKQGDQPQRRIRGLHLISSYADY
jgi:hypothetical protein